MKQRLPGIIKLSYIGQSSLPDDVVLMADSGLKPSITGQLSEVDLVGVAEFTTEENYDNQSTIEKVTLKFATCDDVKTSKVGFVATTVENQSYLIGSAEKPALVKKETTSGIPSGESAANAYTVTFEAKKALIPCELS